ncbi:MAG: DNA gyrase inhibitor YacG [Porticoccaceae bacterium]|nr:DNA gyrase inhibitor YacG [Porticoccaceae bacterium]MBT3799055.1 DNA gyrase inhibitor YacG [Porticoccaceae bacterium]MBT4164753.1 DNA gyrase inhibitor YacG [Porticoccaceae bacterium]MBT4210328.1 DNA gyrase inhibitor YacG [Porticoccaceae bacterium]MBT4591798.1 DNA gyrase inhibitor YacG [Porticoccaceae bacterium]
MTEPTIVKCPTCKTGVAWAKTQKYRPFCSHRCQQIDFGDWATESYSIPVDPIFEDGQLSEDDLGS